jgi:hypothetical protein
VLGSGSAVVPCITDMDSALPELVADCIACLGYKQQENRRIFASDCSVVSAPDKYSVHNQVPCTNLPLTGQPGFAPLAQCITVSSGVTVCSAQQPPIRCAQHEPRTGLTGAIGWLAPSPGTADC